MCFQPILLLGEIMKQEDYKRQLVIANSLYEMGLDEDLIKKITTVNSKDLNEYRKTYQKKSKDVDNNLS